MDDFESGKQQKPSC